MASPTQMVVVKDKPNLLIIEDILKISRDLIPLIPSKSLTSLLWNGRTTKRYIYFSSEMITVEPMMLTSYI